MAGRPSKRRTLAVWMNGEAVGHWTLAPDGHRFVYLEAWLGSPSARAISLSMPLEQGTRPFAGDRVEAYFENLLPESIAIRKRIAQKFGTSASTFDLLAHIGRDCVGAVQLLPLDVEPTGLRRIDAEPLTDGQVEALLDATISNAPIGLGDEEGLRISIAGAQEKTALLHHAGRWCRPLGATPTTHILKLPMGEVGHVRADFSTSVENEWLCAQIAREFGFAMAECEILRFGHHKVLSVMRFDRMLLDGWWARRPQEDFCQALGVPAERKYEEHGGPGMADILRVLRGSDGPKEDRLRFLAAQLLFWLLAAPDGHAKNFSIFLLPGSRFRLTPLYDIMSAWPIIGSGARQFPWQKVKLAMAVRSKNVHYRMHDVQRRHWSTVARANALGPDFEPVIEDFVRRAPEVVEAVSRILPARFPAGVSEPIFQGLLSQTRRLDAGQIPGA